MQLTSNAYVETGFSGANVGYIITGEGVVMVDTPYRPTDAVAWRREIESKGTLKYLVNTEPHFDHCAGSFFFNAPAVAHEKTREKMAAIDVAWLRNSLAAADPAGVPFLDNYRLNIPAITFLENLTLHLGQHTFRLLHTPGHSRGQLAAYIPEEGIVFTGDNVTFRIKGFLHDADPFAWLESLKLIGELDVQYIVPGHGDVCDKSYLKEQTAYIQGAIDAVRQAIKQGMSREEAANTVVFPSPYPLDEGSGAMAKMLIHDGIAELYDMLSTGQN